MSVFQIRVFRQTKNPNFVFATTSVSVWKPIVEAYCNMQSSSHVAHIKNVTTEAEFDALVQESQDKVVIVDLYQTWCGPCSALEPSFNKVVLEYELANERISFYRCDFDGTDLSARIQASFPSDTQINLDKNGCLPLTAVYRFGSTIGLIQGVDGPQVLNLIDINLPPLKDE